VLEVKAAFLATKRLRHYLLGIEFDLVTDGCSGNFEACTVWIYKQVNGQELLAVPKCMEKEVITSSHNFGHMGTQKTMQINNFTREFIKKNYFYFLFTKLHFTTFL